MQNLISHLMRLYLPHDAATPEQLARHVRGETTLELSLTGADGMTRALYLPFARVREGEPDAHWNALCELANTLQQALGLPAPAVSIDGERAFGLWLSFAQPLPAREVQDFARRLLGNYVPQMTLPADHLGQPRLLPPCRNPRTGLWAAFVHPGMGAAFIDEAGLEVAPPAAAQLAFLETLESITPQQFARALELLAQEEPEGEVRPVQAAAGAAKGVAKGVAAGALPDGLLLRDATLEDIVRELHARGIEPTFRHVLPRRGE